MEGDKIVVTDGENATTSLIFIFRIAVHLVVYTELDTN